MRGGLLTTRSGVIHTPFFMPIATRGAVKHLSTEDLLFLGAEIVLGNTYHLWLRPGDDLIAEAGDPARNATPARNAVSTAGWQSVAGGLHAFMQWEKPILTDSGGFQVFSLGARAEKNFGTNGPACNAMREVPSLEKLLQGEFQRELKVLEKKRSITGRVNITEEGVEFIDPSNGKKYFLSPEKSIDIQLNLGSDIIMVLDECPPYPCTEEYALASLERTTRWAKRAKVYFEKKMADILKEKRPLLFGIVQGSLYENLRRESAHQITALDFDGYAIGGVAVGEPRETLSDILDWVLPLLPEDKPRYLMGLGKPEEIVRAVEVGVDMFDCVIPTREGRHGRLFYWTGEAIDETEKFYTTKNLTSEEFKKDFSPIDPESKVEVLRKYSKSYLRHLFSVEEPLAGRLATLHNLSFYLELMRRLQEEK